jgi:hypothetical protein
MGRGNPMHNNPLANINKQKPSWRCDVCNYETGVARNLRIHMTSEKHTHNIMVLQQNVKHMQQQLSHQQPGVNVKNFFSSLLTLSTCMKVSVSGKPLWSSLMPGAFPKGRTLKVLHSCRLQPYLQTLD